MPKYTQDLKLISEEDQESFGQIFSRYRYLNSSGLPTTNGFVIGFSGFDQALTQLRPKLKAFVQHEFNSTEKIKAFEKLLLPNLALDSNLKNEIEKKLKNLKPPFLIRASSRNSSERETLTFETVVKNHSETYTAILSAWASFIYNEEDLGNAIEKASVCVCITQKNQPDVSGRAFILGGEDSRIEIQTQWGEFKPTEKSDVVQLKFTNLAEESYLISPQPYQLVYKSGKYESIRVAEKFQNSRKIDYDQAEKIARSLKKLQSALATSIELGFEIIDTKIILDDLNFNIEKGQKSQNIHFSIDLPTLKNLKPLLPGIVSGFGKIIENSKDLKKLQIGDIAILNSFKKEYLPALKKASGIVIQNSENLSNQLLPKLHSLGITSVAGSLKILPQQVLTLNGKTGKVYLGAFSPRVASKTELVESETKIADVKTATKVFVTLNTTTFNDLKNQNIDGIGPVRPELFFTRFGIHPKELVKKSEFHQVSEDIKHHLTSLCTLMSEKPVIYQVSDFKTNELIHLSQGASHETAETNPFLGKRGAFRHLQNPEIIKSELELIKNLRNKANFKNLWVSLPFIRTKNELSEIKKIVSQSGLNRSPSFKLLVTISTPANIYSIEDLIAEGIDGCLIDYYDLANLLYGKDFSYSELANLQDDAIIKALQILIKPLSKAKLFSGIFNFPSEISPKLFKDIVSLGIKSVSVREINVDQAKKELSLAEKQLVAKSNS